MEARNFNFSADGSGYIKYVDGDKIFYAVFFEGAYRGSVQTKAQADTMIWCFRNNKKIEILEEYISRLSKENFDTLIKSIINFEKSLVYDENNYSPSGPK